MFRHMWKQMLVLRRRSAHEGIATLHDCVAVPVTRKLVSEKKSWVYTRISNIQVPK
jgi:hypothetical protein